jgi:hypothetical protein
LTTADAYRARAKGAEEQASKADPITGIFEPCPPIAGLADEAERRRRTLVRSDTN